MLAISRPSLLPLLRLPPTYHPASLALPKTLRARRLHSSSPPPFAPVHLFYTPLTSTADHYTAHIVLNSPSNRNALSLALLSGLERALDTLDPDSDLNAVSPDGLLRKVRSVIISAHLPPGHASTAERAPVRVYHQENPYDSPKAMGEDDEYKPPAFCAGADLAERMGMSDDDVGEFLSRLNLALIRVEALEVPTIAAIDGPALGGGMELALACDMRVARRSVKALGLPETKLGIIPGAGGTQRLSRLLGPALAKELIFTGRILDAPEAHRLGLLNHITSSEHEPAIRKALEISREIAKNGPLAVKMAKRAIEEGSELDLSEGLMVEQECYAELMPSRDRLEGLRAFSEKRQAVFIGE